jgi:uncharacterized protein (DUF952 family)
LSEPIFHLAEPADWARSTDTFSPADAEEEGFIHCSTAEQLPAVARELYGDHNDLILLTIDPTFLDDETLVYEDLYGLGQDFPHVYGPLPTSAVVATGPYLTHLEEGLWLETRYDREWMDRILHPDFEEVGRSGRTYGRQETIDSRPPRRRFEVFLPHLEYRLELIDEDVALVRYISRPVYDGIERLDHRISIWVNTNDGWRLRFHQGTPLAEKPSASY